MVQTSELRLAVISQDAHVGRLAADACRMIGVRTTRVFESLDRFLVGEALLEPHALILCLGVRTFAEDIGWVQLYRRDPAAVDPMIPILTLLPKTEFGMVKAAIGSGANELLSLPLAPARLEKTLAAAMAQSRPFVRSATYVGPCRRRFRDQVFEGPDRRRKVAGAANAGPEDRAARKARLAQALDDWNAARD